MWPGVFCQYWLGLLLPALPRIRADNGARENTKGLGCYNPIQLTSNPPAVSPSLHSFGLVPPLKPRKAYFGGQTGAVALHAVAGEGEEIHYVDVTSLYPWVNKNCLYPIGHPQIITQPVDQSLGSYFGIATVDILPPASLFHPVLPICSGDKLTFPLCCTCVQEEQAKPMLQRTHYCHHWDVDWMLRSTWCTSELVKAVEKDYILHKIHEVWHFPEAQRWTGLFADYVNTRLKIKKESAGWPSWCQTMDQKREYILRYQDREGIRLDVSQMVKNPGRKAKAKLMLNRYPFYVLFSCCHSTLLITFFPSWSFLGQIWGTG